MSPKRAAKAAAGITITMKGAPDVEHQAKALLAVLSQGQQESAVCQTAPLNEERRSVDHDDVALRPS